MRSCSFLSIKYFLSNSFLDITLDLENNKIEVHSSKTESFKVTLIDTGLNTNTAGRIKKIKQYLNNETFMLTYGDGVSNINLNELLEFHKAHGKIATLTSIQIPGRFGNLDISKEGNVNHFQEKPEGDGMWINGGFFVLDSKIFDYLDDDMDNVQWEKGPLLEIAKDNQLAAFKHNGFWKCMDALRDRIELEQMWSTGNAEWKIW